MRPERELFEVAVYRVGLDAWTSDAIARRERAVEEMLAPIRTNREVEGRDRLWATNWTWRTERLYGWDYNEVIAWIRLLWHGPGAVVKGYAWRVSRADPDPAHRRRSYRRGFVPYPFIGGQMEQVLETWLEDRSTDDEIYAHIRRTLCRLAEKDEPFSGRHLDLRIFDTIGPHTAWRRLVGLSDR